MLDYPSPLKTLDNPIRCTTVRSQYIKVLHVRPKVWKVLEKKMLKGTGMDKGILKQTPISQEIIIKN